MFSIQTNKEIRVNRGDTLIYPLYINIGSNYKPEIYNFRIPLSVTHSSDIEATIDEDKWRYKVLEAGTYRFIYQNNAWSLNDTEVDLSNYGITLNSESYQDGDYIEIQFSLLNNDSTIYFDIYSYNSFCDDFISEKVIFPKENRVIQYLGSTEEPSYTKIENCVDSYGRIILQLHEEDTETLQEGIYVYQVRARLFNEYKNDYDTVTITNRTPIYIIDDDFTMRKW